MSALSATVPWYRQKSKSGGDGVVAHTPDPRRYHPTDVDSAQSARLGGGGPGGFKGAIIPRGRNIHDGRSMGFDHEKAGTVIVDPQFPGSVVIDMASLTNQEVEAAITSVGEPIGEGIETDEATFEVLSRLGKQTSDATDEEMTPEYLRDEVTVSRNSPRRLGNGATASKYRPRNRNVPQLSQQLQPAAPAAPVYEAPQMPAPQPYQPQQAPSQLDPQLIALIAATVAGMQANNQNQQSPPAPRQPARPTRRREPEPDPDDELIEDEVEEAPEPRRAPASSRFQRKPAPARHRGNDGHGMDFLGDTAAAKPTARVVFNLGPAGTLQKRYHAVIETAQALTLVYDTRYEAGEQYSPAVAPETPIAVTLPAGPDRAENKTYVVTSVGLQFAVGCLDMIVLIVVQGPEDAGPPTPQDEINLG